MNLLLATVLVLVSAVAIGIYLAFLGLRQHRRAPGLGLTHAALALSGITLLFTLIFTGPSDKLNNVAAMMLFFALVGGGMVFALHDKNRPPSMGAVIAHAIAGLVGITLLVINLFIGVGPA